MPARLPCVRVRSVRVRCSSSSRRTPPRMLRTSRRLQTAAALPLRPPRLVTTASSIRMNQTSIVGDAARPVTMGSAAARTTIARQAPFVRVPAADAPPHPAATACRTAASKGWIAAAAVPVAPTGRAAQPIVIVRAGSAPPVVAPPRRALTTSRTVPRRTWTAAGRAIATAARAAAARARRTVRAACVGRKAVDAALRSAAKLPAARMA
jgi:hypothetical protein